MNSNRRTLIKNGAILTAIGAIPNSLQALVKYRSPASETILLSSANDSRTKELCMASIAAAQEAGASYTDVRLVHTYHRKIGGIPPEAETMTFGVRTLVNGYWGFAASPVWTLDEAARLGKAAVRQAKANFIDEVREIDLTPVKPVSNGEWIMPIKDDPFRVNPHEITDYLSALTSYVKRWPGVTPTQNSAEFLRQDKVFASSSDQYLFQRTYTTSATIGFDYAHPNGMRAGVALDTLTPAGKGLEHIRDQPIRELLRQRYEEIKEDLSFTYKPVEVGRYQIALDDITVSRLLSKTIGGATELDRALGFEANSGGTSYITDPVAMVGTLKVGSPLVTVTANRSEIGAVATVKWDDDGSEPQDLSLVDKGIVVGMQTNRETAGWLNKNMNHPSVQYASSGCAYAPDGSLAPLTHSGNLKLQPGSDGASFDSIVKEVEDGLVFKRADASMDFQQISGLMMGQAFEVKKGKRTSIAAHAGVLFRTPELWNAVTRVGASQRVFGLSAAKGQPARGAYHSVTSSPVYLKEATVVDISRKA